MNERYKNKTIKQNPIPKIDMNPVIPWNTTLDLRDKRSLKYEQTLFEIVNLIALNQKQVAQNTLNQLLDQLNADDQPQALNYLVFARAIAERLAGSVAAKANLYLKHYDLPQIHLFNLLAEDVTLVSAISQLVTNLFADICQNREEVTLIDIGIGTGRQVVDLLTKLDRDQLLPQRMVVIGIEPSPWSLDLAQQNCQEAAFKLGIEMKFVPFCKGIEDLTSREWDDLKQSCQNPVINASFALHHIRDINRQDVRTLALQRLRSLNPALLVLSEPNVNHLKKDFSERFLNSWRHYGTMFRLIDSLSLNQGDKNALKACFFGREVIDVLAVSEENRTERHEETASWLHRLRTSGFRLKTPQLDPEFRHSSSVDINLTPDYFSFEYDGEPIVSVMCAASSSIEII